MFCSDYHFSSQVQLDKLQGRGELSSIDNLMLALTPIVLVATFPTLTGKSRCRLGNFASGLRNLNRLSR